MDASAVFRLISLIPDRSARGQSGSVFSPSEAAACRHPDRMSYLTRFLHWLGPLEPMSREDQQSLGVRSSGGRPLVADEEAGDEMEELEDLEAEESIQILEPGTPIAPTQLSSTVGG